ncbi:MAG: M23 family metallopeptidase [Bacteroidales bacterium]|nr:M23 family metallopeptidase [Bacteroidales bacterium]
MGLKDWWTKVKTWPINDVIRQKHRFVVMDTDTFKEKFSFQLSGANLFVTIGITIIVLILLTTVIIAFTPLREWIPGYTNNRMVEQTYSNAKKIDSLENELENQEWLLATIQAVLRGEEIGGEYAEIKADSATNLQQLASAYRHSVEDSLLRREVEEEDNSYQLSAVPANAQPSSVADAVPAITHLFFSPLKGKILTQFNPPAHSMGIDIAGSTSQTANAAYSGTVVFSGFTAEAGHVLMLQHPGNVVSIYSNCSALLKHRGDVVRVGEPVAYVGSSSLHPEYGPYLHFELWVGGAPVNPEEYISF